MEDLEENLQAFHIRADTGREDDNQSPFLKPNIHKGIPILCCHLKDAKPLDEHQNTFSAFAGAIKFESVICFVRIVGRKADNKMFHQYVVDDGTGLIELSINNKREVLEEMRRTQTEVLSMYRHSKNISDRSLSDSLCRILESAIEATDFSNLKINSKLLVFGRPNLFRGEITINAYSIAVDESINRDTEIAFKDRIIAWYESNVKQKSKE